MQGDGPSHQGGADTGKSNGPQAAMFRFLRCSVSVLRAKISGPPKRNPPEFDELP